MDLAIRGPLFFPLPLFPPVLFARNMLLRMPLIDEGVPLSFFPFLSKPSLSPKEDPSLSLPPLFVRQGHGNKAEALGLFLLFFPFFPFFSFCCGNELTNRRNRSYLFLSLPYPFSIATAKRESEMESFSSFSFSSPFFLSAIRSAPQLGR